MSKPITAGRRAALLLGLPLVAVAITWNGYGLVALAAHTTVVAEEAFDVPGARLIVNVGDGEVTVDPSGDGRVHVKTISRFSFRAPAVGRTLDATGLRLSSDCTGWWRSDCSVSYVIAVPPTYFLDVRGGDGTIAAAGLSGDARLSTTDGDIRLSEMSGALELTSSDGWIDGRGLSSATVTARSRDGAVDLSFNAPPSAVSATTSAGSVSVRVPGVSDGYRIAATSSDGGRNVDDGLQNAGSSRVINLTSSDGDIELQAATVAG